MKAAVKVGVLALQGAFREHKQVLERLGAEVTEVRLPKQLESLAGVVIPGGESTTIVKLMQLYGLDEALKTFYGEGGAVWGTCAGAIAISSSVSSSVAGRPEQPHLSLLDLEVARNDYGRQVASFETDLDVEGFASPFRAVFIRAPRMTRVGPDVEVLASYQNDPVMVTKDRLLATVFHPELSGDDRVHAQFLELAGS